MLIFNTLTRRKEEFQPREPGQVSIYVCGPTTYNYIHLGNARPLVFFDTVRRYFSYKGYKVLYVQNFTDVDDKIINRAREEGEDPLDLARKYIDEYYTDADVLNVLRADRHPRVSEHIPDIVRMIGDLVSQGYAYEVDGDVYFEVRRFAGYGKLSGRSLDDVRAGARVEVDTRKRDPVDFALWKTSRAGEPSWDSPWGPGRPGWHIECSVMSQLYLGNGFDIHGGGYDLVFPHHENEIAQSEAATGSPFVRYWMHNGFITVNEEKMSKSLGNFFLVREILARFPPDTVRFFLLSTHYRSPLDFDHEKMAVAGRSLERIKTSIRLLEEALRGTEQGAPVVPRAVTGSFDAALDNLKISFEAAMDDDFNTALAIGVVFDLVREANTFLQRLGGAPGTPERALLDKAVGLFSDINDVLGIFPAGLSGRSSTGISLSGRSAAATRSDAGFSTAIPGSGGDSAGLVEGLLDLIIEVRQEARRKKDWPAADRIRDGLKELGILLEDTPQGVRWKKQG